MIALAPEHVHWVRRTHPAVADRTGHPAPPGPRPRRPTPRRSPSGWPALGLADVELEDWEEVIDPGGGDAEDFAALRPRGHRRSIDELRPAAGGRRDAASRADEAAALAPPDRHARHAARARASRPPSSRRSAGAPTGSDLRIGGALLTVLTDLFSHPNVHYLSGFYGPLERLLRDTRRQHRLRPGRLPPLRRRSSTPTRPAVMCTAAAPPDADGWCSLSLHAGATVGQLHAAGADPDRLLVVEVSDQFPRTFGARRRTATRVHVDEIDVLIESDRAPITTEDPPPTDVERAIAEHVRAFVPDGATLQTGHRRGAVDRSPRCWPRATGGGYGIHSEMFTTGLMRLHQAGKVTNRKGSFDGRVGGHVRGRHPRALRLAAREPRGGVPARRRS